MIQETLNKISVNTTTISVAHRVKTIMNAHLIHVLKRGRVFESGKFTELRRFEDLDHAMQEEEMLRKSHDLDVSEREVNPTDVELYPSDREEANNEAGKNLRPGRQF